MIARASAICRLGQKTSLRAALLHVTLKIMVVCGQDSQLTANESHEMCIAMSTYTRIDIRHPRSTEPAEEAVRSGASGRKRRHGCEIFETYPSG